MLGAGNYDPTKSESEIVLKLQPDKTPTNESLPKLGLKNQRALMIVIPIGANKTGTANKAEYEDLDERFRCPFRSVCRECAAGFAKR